MINEPDAKRNELIKDDGRSLSQLSGSNLSLSEKLRVGLEEVKVKKGLRKKIFLLDVSGSMDEQIDRTTKLAHLKTIMKNYPAAKKVCFSTDIYATVDKEGYANCDIPHRAGGSTNLAGAINFLRRLPKRPERVILISDGEPDDDRAALQEAIIFEVPFDIIYIGTKGCRGEHFMINLAKRTGGKEFTIEVEKHDFQRQLSAQIAGLLTPGTK